MTVTRPDLARDIEVARGTKAMRVVATMRRQGVDATAAARLTREARKALEADAGVKAMSEETWRMALGVVAGSTRVLCGFCGQGDPLGVPGPRKPLGHDGPCAQ